MKTILVLTDFSIRAGYAAEFAMHLAVKNNAKLLLCHAMEPSTSPNETEFNWVIADAQISSDDDAMMDLKQIGRDLIKSVTRDGKSPDYDIEYIVEIGNVCSVARKIIAEKNVDIVVIGSHPSNALTRILTGSHIYNFIDRLNCPVLLVPESLRYKGIRTIAYATDLTFDNSKVIKYLVKMAQPFNAAISINHIFKNEFPLNEAEQAYSHLLTARSKFSYPKISYHNLKRENVKTGLSELISSGQIDILATVHKRYDFFDRLFHKSITKLIADASQIPLLVLPHSFSKSGINWSNDQLDAFCFNKDAR